MTESRAANTDPRAWAVAIALARESKLGWGDWASGETADPRPASWWCTRCERAGNPEFGSHTPTWATRAYCRVCIHEFVDPTMRADGTPIPVPAPWDVDAYLADCARRGVEPGPLPSLSWTGEDGFGWEVHGNRSCIYVEFIRRIDHGGELAGWSSERDRIHWYVGDDDFISLPRALVGRIYTAASAAAKAMMK